MNKVDKIDGLQRLRFMTSHPKDLSDELIARLDNNHFTASYINDMKKYYSDEQTRKYGVLGIEIELTDLDYVLKLLEEQRENEFERLFPDGIK